MSKQSFTMQRWVNFQSLFSKSKLRIKFYLFLVRWCFSWSTNSKYYSWKISTFKQSDYGTLFFFWWSVVVSFWKHCDNLLKKNCNLFIKWLLLVKHQPYQPQRPISNCLEGVWILFNPLKYASIFTVWDQDAALKMTSELYEEKVI